MPFYKNVKTFYFVESLRALKNQILLFKIVEHAVISGKTCVRAVFFQNVQKNGMKSPDVHI